ncbi:hypothetical protein A2U01_0057270 [Trifolium medium]|uniref:Uncharacterized protein n=1 Tax=Trifolium medium TaxID=97028 RepID=A0A392RHG6_9FABA|nr:hypothetical protein [Trifolium medium]
MRLPGSQEKKKNGLIAVNCAQLRSAEPGAGKEQMEWEVLPSAPGVGIAELGAGVGICTYKLEMQSQN